MHSKKSIRANVAPAYCLLHHPLPHRSTTPTLLIKLLVSLLFLLSSAVKLLAQTHQNHLVNVDANGVILDGHDPVAFFTDSKPVKGSPEYQSQYDHATYYFASADHKKLFDAEPTKYAPQFGAFCAYAVSLGRTAPIDVNTWSIVNDRLVIQHNQKAVDGWNKDVQGNLQKADHYWPEVVKNHGKQIRTDEEAQFLVNVRKDGVILDGHDAVAFFTENKPVKGTTAHESRYQGATYLFSSEENKKQFDTNPQKYAPQYGGYCAYAASVNKLRPIDVNVFQIEGNRIFFQHTKEAYDLFNQDTQGNIQKADANWPGLVKKHAGKPVKYDKPAQ